MYTCKICNTEFKSVDPMGMHLSRKHNMTVESYYEQYIKKENMDENDFYNIVNSYYEKIIK